MQGYQDYVSWEKAFDAAVEERTKDFAKATDDQLFSIYKSCKGTCMILQNPPMYAESAVRAAKNLLEQRGLQVINRYGKLHLVMFEEE